MTRHTESVNDFSIVAADKFIQATRDSGYQDTPSAISELVDNAIQANASKISIDIEKMMSDQDPVISILDNGCGY